MKTFPITWEIDDGYACGGRPRTLYVRANDFFADDTEADIIKTIHEMIDDALRECVTAIYRDEDVAAVAALIVQQNAKAE